MRRTLAQAPVDGDPIDFLARQGHEPGLLATAGRLAREEALRLLDRLAAAGWRWLVPGDGVYPALLAAVSDPPIGLFCRGSLDDGGPTVAVVGSRRASPYGSQVACWLGEELSRLGVVVVSGMARGVDAAAHQGALAAGGKTVAVWGTGPDRVYPPEHRDLAEAIARSGAIVTEYPPGTPARRHHFPQRNRILAGLAQAVVVVEAGPRSGALITARLALDEGREVLAVPGSVFSELSLGPNALLSMGARPLLSPRDAAEAIGIEVDGGSQARNEDDDLGGLIAAGEALTVDEMAERARVAVPTMLTRVLRLEIDGRLQRLDDGRYRRR